MVSLETRKYNIISQITVLNNEQIISEVENFIKNIFIQLNYSEIFKPLKKELKIEEMIKEQNYKGVDRQKFDTLVAELDIKEPISELLAMV